ncbi:MAG: AlkA N-terminal domain-containing protein [Myxococcota bacterium]
MLDAEACYRALVARDPRFDGHFFVGVTTTGVYCRPVCRAKTPGFARCQFFLRGAEAEKAGFRACFRCRPEIAPGRSSVDARHSLAERAARRIEEGALNEGSVDDLGRELGVAGRHLRRVIQEELGVSPIELAQSRRLAIAKALLADGASSMTEVAFASGFSSVRRFNAAFRARFGRAPRSVLTGTEERAELLSIALSYRPPLAWDALLRFLAGRATLGVERVEGGVYARTVRLQGKVGYLRIEHLRPGALRAGISATLVPVFVPLVAKLKRMLDLDAEPEVIDRHLAKDPALRGRVKRTPGLRLAGAIDPFELAVRAVLGQQVTVKAATTIAGRLAQRFGDPIATGVPGLDRVFPTPERVAALAESEIIGLGMPGARARTVLALANAIASGRIVLAHGADADAVIEALDALPGIGPWTASYIAMRALSVPDAFPSKDLGLMRALDLKDRALNARAEAWRPWRAYAALHLWNDGSGG